MLQSPQATAARTGALLRTATAYTYPPSPATPQATCNRPRELIKVVRSPHQGDLEHWQDICCMQ